MKSLFSTPLITLATLAFTSLLPFNAVQGQGSAFEETEIEQTEVIAVARPYGEDKFDIFIVQQIKGKKQCWQEEGQNPVLVKPLLLEFDFTGHCNRATDSNGYSIRMDGQDYGLDLLLRLVPRSGELVLVGTPRRGGGGDVIVGRTYGLQRDFLKIILEPGWKFTKRTYGGKVLGHFYFSGTQNPPTVVPDTPTTLEIVPQTPESLPESSTVQP